MATKTLDKPEAMNGVAHGYLPGARPRYRWVTCEWTGEDGDDPDNPAEPFRAEIRTNLTWGEIDTIDLSGGLTYAQLWDVLAPHVRAWNALGRNVETDGIEPVPPPAEAGPEAFRAIEPGLTMWLATQLRTIHLGGDERGKD